MVSILKHDHQLILKYYSEYRSGDWVDEKMQNDERVVSSVFDKFDNTSIENIMIKSIVLNDRYSAGLNSFKSSKKNISMDVESVSEVLKEYYELNLIYDKSK